MSDKVDLFKDLLPSIMETKKPIPHTPKDYNTFVINRALSYHSDCLYEANEMNLLPKLDKDLQYRFLINTIRPARRPFAKWSKPPETRDLAIVKMYFGYGEREALAALHALSDDQLAQIRTILKSGEQ